MIKRHLEQDPDDLWAWAQKEVLLTLPNIQRGGLMGNTSLTTWGLLYASDVLADVLEAIGEEEGEEEDAR